MSIEAPVKFILSGLETTSTDSDAQRTHSSSMQDGFQYLEADLVEDRIIGWLESAGVYPESPSLKKSEYYQKKRTMIFRTKQKRSKINGKSLKTSSKFVDLCGSLLSQEKISEGNLNSPAEMITERALLIVPQLNPSNSVDGANLIRHQIKTEVSLKTEKSSNKSSLFSRRFLGDLEPLELDFQQNKPKNRNTILELDTLGVPQPNQTEIAKTEKRCQVLQTKGIRELCEPIRIEKSYNSFDSTQEEPIETSTNLRTISEAVEESKCALSVRLARRDRNNEDGSHPISCSNNQGAMQTACNIFCMCLSVSIGSELMENLLECFPTQKI